eukprot:gene5471-977_t
MTNSWTFSRVCFAAIVVSAIVVGLSATSRSWYVFPNEALKLPTCNGGAVPEVVLTPPRCPSLPRPLTHREFNWVNDEGIDKVYKTPITESWSVDFEVPSPLTQRTLLGLRVKQASQVTPRYVQQFVKRISQFTVREGDMDPDTITVVQFRYSQFIFFISPHGHLLNVLPFPTEVRGSKFVNASTLFVFPSPFAIPAKPISRTFYLVHLTSHRKVGTITYTPTWLGVSHHDAEYNPYTETTLVPLRGWHTEGQTARERRYVNEKVVIFDLQGHTLWQWSLIQHYFVLSPVVNMTIECEEHFGKECVDLFHANTVYWDLESSSAREGQGIFYFLLRHTSTMLAVDIARNDIAWSLGHFGNNFRQYNMAGQQVKSLFYMAHTVEKVGPREFTVFDNNAVNFDVDGGHTDAQQSRIVRFSVDTENFTARETWVHTLPKQVSMMGNAHSLPNGNYFTTMSTAKSVVEVNSDHRVVWQMDGWGSYRVEKFLQRPGLVLTIPSSLAGPAPTLQVSAWDTYHARVGTRATIQAFQNGHVLAASEVFLEPHWQPTKFCIPLPALSCGFHNLSVLIVNAAGAGSHKFVRVAADTAIALDE